MAVLNATEFVNGFILGTVVKPEDLANPNDPTISVKIIQNLTQTWSAVLSHIETYIQIKVDPPIQVQFPPALPIAVGTSLSGKIGSGNGVGLKNTASILAPRLPFVPPVSIQNVIFNYNLLFETISESSIVTVQNTRFSGRVDQGTTSVPLSGVSIVPMKGMIV